MSLTGVREKEAKRVRTQESATVSMLTNLLDDDGSSKSDKRKKRKRGISQSAAGGGRSSSSSAQSFHASKQAGGGCGSRVGQRYKANNNRTSSAPGMGGASSAWSDVINAASAGAAGQSNPFGINTPAATAAAGSSRPLVGGGAPRGRSIKSNATLEAAKSLRLAKKKAAVAKKVAITKKSSMIASRGSKAKTQEALLDKLTLQSSAGSHIDHSAASPHLRNEHHPQVRVNPSAARVAASAGSSATASKSQEVAPVKLGISLGLSSRSTKRTVRSKGAEASVIETKTSALHVSVNAAAQEVKAGGATLDISTVGTGASPAMSLTVSEPSNERIETTMNTETDFSARAYGETAVKSSDTDTATTLGDYQVVGAKNNGSSAREFTTGPRTGKKRRTANNDNFVKLNMRNSAGSCRGARNKGKKRSSGGSDRRGAHDIPIMQGSKSDDSEDNKSDWKMRRKEKGGVRLVQNANAGIDPLDDYLDGTYADKRTRATKPRISSSATQSSVSDETPSTDEAQASQTKLRSKEVPRCNRHRRPCKLLTVKKSNTGNKGRKFFVCSLPKGEQCDHFQWQDDTVQSIQKALLQSSSTSGFVARQVAAYVDRFHALTLPELRDEAKRLGLRHVGKKGQILARLTIHVRDEVAKAVGDEKMQIGSASYNERSSLDKENKDKPDGDIDVLSIGNGLTKISSDGGDESTGDNEEDSSSSDESSSDSEDDELELVGGDEPTEPSEDICEQNGNESICNTDDDGESDVIHKDLHKYFGYRQFRQGQEWAIRRVLDQERSLLVAPTGMGKSLCYALPATQMNGVCLVVSPLISLMQDQLRHLPPNIPAATLSGNLSSTQVAMTIDDLLKNRIKILFVSPERLASAGFRRLIRPKYNVEKRLYERNFPTVSLLCLDEAHCLSQWGHNFRPSYLRIRSLLPLLEPKSILALTATAGPMVIKDICHTLDIPTSNVGRDEDEANDGVRVLDCKRDNIDVATLVLDSEDNRRSLLYKLLKDNKKNVPVEDRHELQSSMKSASRSSIQPGCLSSGSVIVYVWRKRDAETVTEQLIGAGIQGGVVCYHGGMGAGERAKAQGKFMRGKARVCVATVAFGLGINKADVKGVIHLCLPPSLEHYLQEIGRAGRNGKPARAIALVLNDEVRIRSSLSHSDFVARSQVEKLCLVIRGLVDCALQDAAAVNGLDGNEAEAVALSSPPISQVQSIDIALPLSSTIDAIDCKEAMIETMLSLLEETTAMANALLSVEGTLTDQVIVTLKRRSLDKLCDHEAIARSIDKCSNRLDVKDGDNSTADSIEADNPLEERLKTEGGTALQKGFLAYSLGTYKFSVLQCARFMGPRAEPRHVFATLRRLQSSGELELALDRTEKGKSLHLRLNMEGIACFRSPEEQGVRSSGLGDALEAVVDRLTSHCAQQVSTGAAKVANMHRVIHRVTDVDDPNSHDADEENPETGKSSRLALFQMLTKDYFENEGKEDMMSQSNLASDNACASCAVPEIAKELSAASDPREYSQLVSDTLALMRDPTLKQRKPYPVAVNITDYDCIDYASCCLAKILHGLDSARAPMSDWRLHPLFGKWRHCTFGSVLNSVESIIRESAR